VSYETRYAATKREQERARDNSPAAIRERLIYQKAAELGRADLEAKFPEVTAENFAAADAYQTERIEFHRTAIAGVKS
jgi:hypothetical protein